jgi:hypothetical protein
MVRYCIKRRESNRTKGQNWIICVPAVMKSSLKYLIAVGINVYNLLGRGSCRNTALRELLLFATFTDPIHDGEFIQGREDTNLFIYSVWSSRVHLRRHSRPGEIHAYDARFGEHIFSHVSIPKLPRLYCVARRIDAVNATSVPASLPRSVARLCKMILRRGPDHYPLGPRTPDTDKGQE